MPKRAGRGGVALLAVDSRARRRIGAIVALWGAIGLVLLVLGAVAVGGILDGGRGPLGLEAERRDLVELLGATSNALRDAETTARDANNGLNATSDAATSASGFTSDLGTSLRELASSLRVSILGSQPLAAPADDLERVADRAAGVATDLDAASTAVRGSGRDMTRLADDIASMRAEVDRVRGGIERLVDLDRWRIATAAILLWLAVPAAVSLAVGLRWWRPLSRRSPRR
ncbi:MAG: hypothetical protein ACJ77B_03920 [Chloroflexota bacterium]